MSWVCVDRRRLIPRLGSKEIVHILDTIISPDSVMHTLPPLCFQGVINVWERGPTALEYLRKQRLVGKDPVGCVGSSQTVGDDLPHTFARSGHDDTGVAQTEACLDWRRSGLGEFWGVMLECPPTIGWDPVKIGRLESDEWKTVTIQCIPILWVMRSLERVAEACMGATKHAIALALHLWRIQLDIHQLIHIVQGHHVAVE